MKTIMDDYNTDMKTATRRMFHRVKAEMARVAESRQVARRERARRLAFLAQERTRLQAEAKVMAEMRSIQHSEIRLNVGGHTYTTSLVTLQSRPDTMLAAMFSGRFPICRNRKGEVFIDRNGKLFAYVLAYLRSDGDALDVDLEDVQLLRRLKHEFDYYGISMTDEVSILLVAGGIGLHHTGRFTLRGSR